MKLKNILIVVDSIERSKQFYKEIFGLNVIADFDGNVILTEGLVLQERNEKWVLQDKNVPQYPFLIWSLVSHGLSCHMLAASDYSFDIINRL